MRNAHLLEKGYAHYREDVRRIQEAIKVDPAQCRLLPDLKATIAGYAGGPLRMRERIRLRLPSQSPMPSRHQVAPACSHGCTTLAALAGLEGVKPYTATSNGAQDARCSWT